MTDQLKVLFPGRELVVGGESLTIQPFKGLQFLKAMKIGKPLLESVRASGIVYLTDGGIRYSSDLPIRALELVADSGDLLVEFLSFAIGKDSEWFEKLELDELIEIGKAVFEENSDFFAKRILPLFGLAVTNPQAVAEDGANSSENSRAQDSDSQK